MGSPVCMQCSAFCSCALPTDRHRSLAASPVLCCQSGFHLLAGSFSLHLPGPHQQALTPCLGHLFPSRSTQAAADLLQNQFLFHRNKLLSPSWPRGEAMLVHRQLGLVQDKPRAKWPATTHVLISQLAATAKADDDTSVSLWGPCGAFLSSGQWFLSFMWRISFISGFSVESGWNQLMDSKVIAGSEMTVLTKPGKVHHFRQCVNGCSLLTWMHCIEYSFSAILKVPKCSWFFSADEKKMLVKRPRCHEQACAHNVAKTSLCGGVYISL